MANKSAKKKSSKKKPAANANSSSAPAPAKKKSAVALAEAKAEKIVKASAESSDKQKGGKKQNPVARYFRELRSEFKKVVWPSKKTVINNTSVVLVAMILSSLVIWGLDSAFVALLELIIR